MYPTKKVFIMEYSRNAIQEKVYGKLIERETPMGNMTYFISAYKDKALTIPVELNKEYVVDYYYEYGDEALIYTI
jgi:hypothetical protein